MKSKTGFFWSICLIVVGGLFVGLASRSVVFEIINYVVTGNKVNPLWFGLVWSEAGILSVILFGSLFASAVLAWWFTRNDEKC